MEIYCTDPRTNSSTITNAFSTTVTSLTEHYPLLDPGGCGPVVDYAVLGVSQT